MSNLQPNCFFLNSISNRWTNMQEASGESTTPNAARTISCKAWNSPAKYPSWVARCDIIGDIVCVTLLYQVAHRDCSDLSVILTEESPTYVFLIFWINLIRRVKGKLLTYVMEWRCYRAQIDTDKLISDYEMETGAVLLQTISEVDNC